VHQPVNEDRRAVLEAKKVPALMPGPGTEDPNGVPAPSSRGMLGKARAAANRAFAETIPVEADGHGNGHGPEIAGEEHAAVGSAEAPAQLPSGESSEEDSGSLAGAFGGSQDACGHQNPQDGGRHVRDRVDGVETGRGGLRPGRDTDEEGGPA